MSIRNRQEAAFSNAIKLFGCLFEKCENQTIFLFYASRENHIGIRLS